MNDLINGFKPSAVRPVTDRLCPSDQILSHGGSVPSLKFQIAPRLRFITLSEGGGRGGKEPK
jgi:hypothetical protein